MATIKALCEELCTIVPITEAFIEKYENTIFESKDALQGCFITWACEECDIDGVLEMTFGLCVEIAEYLSLDGRLVIKSEHIPQWVTEQSQQLELLFHERITIEDESESEQEDKDPITGTQVLPTESGLPGTCAAFGCMDDTRNTFRFCNKHMIIGYSKLTEPDSEEWKKHLEWLERMSDDTRSTNDNDLWLVDCEFITFPHVQQIPHELAVYAYPTLRKIVSEKVGYESASFNDLLHEYDDLAPTPLTLEGKKKSYNRLRNVYGHLERATGTSCVHIRDEMLSHGLCEGTSFVGFGTSSDTSNIKKIIAGVNGMFVAKQKKKDPYFGQFQPINVHAVAKAMLRCTTMNDGNTLSGLYAHFFGAPNVLKHSAEGDVIMLFDIMRLLGTFRKNRGSSIVTC